jgi:glucose-1-phosphate cytidylyltransferase
MKVVILAGGQGTRLAEETETRPKPMVEIGDRPIVWHIMKHYQRFGHSEFFLALGYRGEAIKRYFLDCLALEGSMTVQFPGSQVVRHGGEPEQWTVHLVETGKDSGTGGRVRRLESWIGPETFMLTYGDGLSNIDLDELLAFHRAHGKMITVSAVRPPARFGALEFEKGQPVRFREKPQLGEGWINGGFMVVEPEVFDRIPSDESSLESDVLEPLAEANHVMAFPHTDFWHGMDTLRDVRYLRDLWDTGKASWLSGPWN